MGVDLKSKCRKNKQNIQYAKNRKDTQSTQKRKLNQTGRDFHSKIVKQDKMREIGKFQHKIHKEV